MIRAALEQASFEDCIRKNGDCVENKILFVKHPVSNEMYGYTKIYEGHGNDWDDLLIKYMVFYPLSCQHAPSHF